MSKVAILAKDYYIYIKLGGCFYFLNRFSYLKKFPDFTNIFWLNNDPIGVWIRCMIAKYRFNLGTRSVVVFDDLIHS